MRYTRTRVLAAGVSDFFVRNRKLIICFTAVFAVGLIIGIVATINSYDGAFERVARGDMDFGAVKVFFFSVLFIAAGYFVILLATLNSKIIFIAIAPFIVLGIFAGKYTCLLIACYASLGIINLLLVYLPFFIATFFCMLVGAVLALSFVGCECGGRSKLRPPLMKLLKVYGVNVCFCFIVFLIIGSMTGVIVVAG